MAVDGGAHLLVADANGKVWQFQADGSRKLIAGRDQFDGDGGPAVNALLKRPAAVVVQSDGALVIGDTGNNRIRKVSLDGSIVTVAGNGVAGSAGDGGPAAEAQIAGPDSLALDPAGNVYLASQSYLKVRRLRTDGVIETVAGTGAYGRSGDGGPATSATFLSIIDLAVDRAGRLFISDRDSERVRIVNTNGIIEAYAGTGLHGAGGDGIAAVASPLSSPTRLAVDSAGNLVIFESGYPRLRRVSVTGIITTIPLGRPGDSAAASRCFFGAISALAFDLDDTLLVAGNNVICRLMPDGTSWAVAGSRNIGFSGDGGPALSASFRGPSGLAVSATGDIYFADSGNHRIRRLRRDNFVLSVAVAPINGSGSPQNFTATYSDTAGGADISYVTLLFNSTFSSAGGCWIQYFRASNTLFLVNDLGSGLANGSIHPGAGGTLSNSQCTIADGGAITITGNNLTLSVTVTYAAAFVGSKTVYAAATTNAHLDSSWLTIGTWGSGLVQPPAIISVSPINNTATQQTFTAIYSSTAGGADLGYVTLLFNPAMVPSDGCWIQYFRASNTLLLVNDSGSGVVPGSIQPGAAGTLSNTQCMVGNAGAITITGNNLALPVAITFAP